MLEKTINQYKTENEVICACSGGIDSISLAFSMKNAGFKMHVLIVNHNLRKNSDSEALKVQETLGESGFETVKILHWGHEKIKTGIEEKARNARFNLIFEYALKHKIKDIFLGHHLGDVIETFFLKLGSGGSIFSTLSAEKKIRWNGHKFNLIRPFVAISKEEIIKYGVKHNLQFVQDETNFEDTFKRNRIRKNLPLAMKNLEIVEDGILQKLASIQFFEKIIAKRIDEIFNTIIIFDKNFAFFKASKRNLHEISQEEMELCLKRMIFYFSEKTDFRRKELQNGVRQMFANPNFTLGFMEVFSGKDDVYFIKEKAKITQEIVFGIWDLRFKIENLPHGATVKLIDFKMKNSPLPAKILRTLPAIFDFEKKLIAVPNFLEQDFKNNNFIEVNDEA